MNKPLCLEISGNDIFEVNDVSFAVVSGKIRVPMDLSDSDNSTKTRMIFEGEGNCLLMLFFKKNHSRFSVLISMSFVAGTVGPILGTQLVHFE